jgi:hypothetical protein
VLRLQRFNFFGLVKVAIPNSPGYRTDQVTTCRAKLSGICALTFDLSEGSNIPDRVGRSDL